MVYEPIFNVVLHEPEIPQNTGNIGRLCLGTKSHLHLVGRLGFSLDEKSRRRAGLDYWEKLIYSRHQSFEVIESSISQEHLFFFSKKASQSLYTASFHPGDYLVFGSETTGLPEHIHKKYEERMYRIPMLGEVRSFNLANSVAIVVFEALRSSGIIA